MITRELLRLLRNDLPMAYTLKRLGDRAPANKIVEGRCRFVCLYCGEWEATVNPRNNLAHCFNCRKNTNNIDLLVELDHNFLQAVETLKHWLKLYQKERLSTAQVERKQRRERQIKQAQTINQILREYYS